MCQIFEISVVRQRQENEENVIVYPIVLSPTTKAALCEVEEFNPRPRGGRPLKRYNGYKREEKMCEIADELDDIASKIRKNRAARVLLGDSIFNLTVNVSGERS